MDILGRATAALRATDRPEELADSRRQAIVAAAWKEAQDGTASWTPTFRPARWLALVGLAPVALAIVAVLMVGPASPDARIAGADKVGDDVVFTIANGNHPHTVVRSTDPAHFNDKAKLPVADGRFTDQANNGPVIVFYRLD